MPMGMGDDFEGVIDLVTMEAITFDGDDGEKVVRGPIPAELRRGRRQGPARRCSTP